MRVLIGVVAGLLLVCGAASASIITQETWEVDIAGWTSAGSAGEPAYGTIAQASMDGDGALRITRDGAGEDYIYTAESGWAGNWSSGGMGVRQISFDFYANADDGGEGGGIANPGALEIYFYNGADEWRLTLDVSEWSEGWYSIARNLVYGAGWYSPGHGAYGANDFNSALGQVDEIGILLTYQAWSGQEYGLDNFALNNEYVIPEPGTYALLAFTFLSLGLTLRRGARGRKSAPGAKAQAGK